CHGRKRLQIQFHSVVAPYTRQIVRIKGMSLNLIFRTRITDMLRGLAAWASQPAGAWNNFRLTQTIAPLSKCHRGKREQGEQTNRCGEDPLLHGSDSVIVSNDRMPGYFRALNRG